MFQSKLRWEVVLSVDLGHISVHSDGWVIGSMVDMEPPENVGKWDMVGKAKK
jgi:hypothetical protein